MDISPWVVYAQFITLVLAIVGYIGSKIFFMWRRGVGKAVDAKEVAGRLAKLDNCETDIHYLQEHFKSLSGNYTNLNKNGSEGAKEEFKIINGKLDKMNTRMSNHSKRLIRIEAYVNGGLDKVPLYPEDTE
jgi:hypothetical protein